MRKILIAGVGVGMAIAVNALAAQQAPDRAAVATIDAAMAKWTASTPGCAVGASLNGAIVVSKAWGMADLEHSGRLA